MKSNVGSLPVASLIVVLFIGILIGIIGTMVTNVHDAQSNISVDTYNALKNRLEKTVAEQIELVNKLKSKSNNEVALIEPKILDSGMAFRKRLSLTHKRMRSRNELTKLLTQLGYFGEGVEIGVRTGDHSKYIMNNWACSKFHMVDREQEHQNQLHDDLKAWMIKNFPNKHEIHRDYSINAAKKFKDNSLDFIYIDARHDYDGVMEDLVAWYPKLQIGGVFAGHDFVPDGNLKEGKFGVQGAVTAFVREKGIEIQSISDKDKNGGRSEPQHVDGGWTTWYFIK